MRKKWVTYLFFVLWISGCTTSSVNPTVASLAFEPTQSQPMVTTPTNVPTLAVRLTPTSAPPPVIWLDASLPEGLYDQIAQQNSMKSENQKELANLWLESGTSTQADVTWVYVLVTPFSSLIEQINFDQLKDWWQGKPDEQAIPILVTEQTIKVLEPVLGELSDRYVVMKKQNELLDAAWEKRDVLAIIPFEYLEPRWKVIPLNDQSPISNQFVVEEYPLAVHYHWNTSLTARENLDLPNLTSNRDESKLTVLVMTGVTALVRATAVRMEQKGMTYPGEAIGDWLRNADLTHISNEVSFSPRCPDPKMDPYPLIFCSKPEYIELLDSVGTDIVDLTGNHGVDWGRDALSFSLDLYRSRGWVYYAAGENLNEAREAVFIEHNGNRFAFLGCNPAGPAYIWAGEDFGGVAPCDYEWIQQRIQQLRDEGYLVIFTFQYFETYRHWVEEFEQRDFRIPADAGAVIVSGSQSHHPMAMEFYNDSFIHYGLGNLFFDQMWVDTVTIPEGTRKELIDRHVFYNGKHISTELLTAYLEDYSRPRPMNAVERIDFLKDIFTAAGWGPYTP
ncbi:MAG: CapA family protein [Chloroflexota bacterium]